MAPFPLPEPPIPMKMAKPKSLGKRTLPGDRQGISGAGARNDTDEIAGDGRLRRRTPISQEATAPNEDQADLLTGAGQLVPTLPDSLRQGNQRAAERREQSSRIG